MTKYFGYKYLANWPMIIEIDENPLGYFYCLLHSVRVKGLFVFTFTGCLTLGFTGQLKLFVGEEEEAIEKAKSTL